MIETPDFLRIVKLGTMSSMKTPVLRLFPPATMNLGYSALAEHLGNWTFLTFFIGSEDPVVTADWLTWWDMEQKFPGCDVLLFDRNFALFRFVPHELMEFYFAFHSFGEFKMDAESRKQFDSINHRMDQFSTSDCWAKLHLMRPSWTLREGDLQ